MIKRIVRKSSKKNILVLVIICLLQSTLVTEAGLFRKKISLDQKYLVAVMPFENHTNEERVEPLRMEASSLMLAELYDAGIFKLVEMEHIGEILGEPLQYPHKDRGAYLKAIKSLGTELILIGSIQSLSYSETSRGKTIVQVTAGARLVNLMNGEIVFMGSAVGRSKKSASAKNKTGSTYTRIDPLVQEAVEQSLRGLASKISRNARYKTH